MRQIKFRGKSVDSNEWVYGFLHECYAKSTCYSEIRPAITVFDKDHFENYEVYPESVGQFTGKKDISGNEIYEGDINQDNGVVKWNDDDCSFIWDYVDIEAMPFEDEENWCEVVATLYENPRPE